MNQLEVHLRDALTDVADEVPASGVPPLMLPADTIVRLGGRQLAGSRRWLAPAAAAAAVLAIVAAAAIVSARPNPPALNPVSQVPPYYLAIPGRTAVESPVAIYATATGRLVTVPRYRGRPLLSGNLAGSADGRTFVIAEPAKSPELQIMVIRFDPATRKASVSPLPAPLMRSPLALEGLALSPDGSRLAVAYQASESVTSVRHDLTTVDLATGRSRTWTSSAGSFSPGPTYYWSVSWAANDRTVAFNWFAGWQKSPLKRLRPGTGVRLLDTTQPGGGLVARSRLALPFSGQGQPSDPAVSAGFALPAWLTPDGKTIVLPVIKFGSQRNGLAAYSARTGALERTLGIGQFYRPAGNECVLWVSRDGSTLIVYSAPGHPKEIGIVQGDNFTLLPRTPRFNNRWTAW